MTALAYGLGTPVWSTASQAMWTHTPAALGYAVALWALTAGFAGTAGVAAGAAAVARPATAPAAAFLVLYAAHRAWRRSSRADRGSTEVRRLTIQAIRCLAGAAIVAVLGMGYNLWLFGNLVGGAPDRTDFWLRELGAASMFSGSLLGGLAGLTISPSRGLLVFSPILILAIVGAIRVWRGGRPPSPPGGNPERDDVILLGRYASLSAVVILLVYAKFVAWWGGHGFGPRYLTDAMPFFGLLVGFGLASTSAFARRYRPSRWAATVVAGLAAYSVFVQAVGAFCWPSPWTLDENPPYYQRLWDWRNNQIVSCIRSGPRLDPAARRVLSSVGLRLEE